MKHFVYKHKTFSKGIKINKNSKFLKLLEKRIREAELCVSHKLNTVYLGKRLYRRGKNRCLRCGALLCL